MPFTQGTSLIGRQVLGTVTGNETRVYVNVRSLGLSGRENKGYLALEYVGTPYPYEYLGRGFYARAVVFENDIPFTLNTEIVCYWKRAGILWRAEWE